MCKLLTLLTLLTLSSASCSSSVGGSDSNVDAGNSEYSYEDYVTDFSEAQCARNVQCGRYSDVASCLKSGKSTLNQFTADIEAGLVIFDLQAARECLAAVATSTCTAVPLPECIDTTGTITAGNECFKSYSCIGDARCDGAVTFDTCTAGVCVERGSAGETCNFGECSSGLDCSGGICLARGGIGADCASVSCEGGLVCTDDGVCAPYANTGANCSFDGCLEAGDFCNDQGVCAPKTEVGGDCSVSECVGYAECRSDTCVASPGEGDSCEEFGATCLGNTRCESGTCELNASPPICSLP